MISAVFLSFQTDMPAVHGLGGMILASAWDKREIHDSEMVPATTSDWCHATRTSGKGCTHALAHYMAGQGSPLSIPRMGRAHALAHRMAGQCSPLSIPRMVRAHGLAHRMAGPCSPLSIPGMCQTHGLAHGREERRRFQIVSPGRMFAYNPHCAYVRKIRGTGWACKGYCLMLSYNTNETLKDTAYSQ